MEWTKYVLACTLGVCMLILFGRRDEGRDKWIFGLAVGGSLAARELTVEDNDTFDEYIRSQNITSYDASYPMFRWHVDIKAGILSEQIPDVGNVTDVNVVSRGLGGIASEVEVKGDGGSCKIKGQSQVRSMLGNTELVIKKQDGT